MKRIFPLGVRHASEPHVISVHLCLEEGLLLFIAQLGGGENGGSGNLRDGQGVGRNHVLGGQGGQICCFGEGLFQGSQGGIAGDGRAKDHIDCRYAKCGEDHQEHDFGMNFFHRSLRLLYGSVSLLFWFLLSSVGRFRRTGLRRITSLLPAPAASGEGRKIIPFILHRIERDCKVCQTFLCENPSCKICKNIIN